MSLSNLSCATVAKRYTVTEKSIITGKEVEKDVMEISGIGSKRAKWADGAEIEREEPLRIPDFPPIKLEYDE